MHLPDLIRPNLQVLFCGVNPGVDAAARGHHFVGRGNRFWKTLHLAGFTPEEIDPENDRSLLDHDFGLTTVVERATARADQVAKHEFAAAAAALQHKLEKYRPRCIAFLGKSAYSVLSEQSAVQWGRQEQTLSGSVAWLLPNSSGRNRGFSQDALAAAYRALRLSLPA